MNNNIFKYIAEPRNYYFLSLYSVFFLVFYHNQTRNIIIHSNPIIQLSQLLGILFYICYLKKIILWFQEKQHNAQLKIILIIIYIFS